MEYPHDLQKDAHCWCLRTIHNPAESDTRVAPTALSWVCWARVTTDSSTEDCIKNTKGLLLILCFASSRSSVQIVELEQQKDL